MDLEPVVAVGEAVVEASPFLDAAGAFANDNAATEQSSADTNRVLKLVM